MSKKMKRMLPRIIWILLTVAVMVVIFVFSAEDTKKSENRSEKLAKALKVKRTKRVKASNRPIVFGLTLRKLAHVLLYFALGFCTLHAMAGWKFRIPGAAAFGYAYAALDEIHQSMTGRYGRWQDTLIDLGGILLGIVLALLLSFLWRQIMKRRRPREVSPAGS